MKRTNFLISYMKLPGHHDPNFEEFTYGNAKAAGKRLKLHIEKGSYVFFHTGYRDKRAITAYFVVDRVLDTAEAQKNKLIKSKYKNPHLSYEPEVNDTLVFGDVVLSRKLSQPVIFDRILSRKLSLNIPFKPNLNENQCISQATRSFRELSEKDIEILMDEIKLAETKVKKPDFLYSTDEIEEIREMDIEYYLEKHISKIRRDLKVIQTEYEVTPHDRIDILCEDKNNDYVIIELKLGFIGKGAYSQIKKYMHELKKREKKNVSGIIICKGIFPAFIGFYKNHTEIEVYKYGWKLELQKI